MKNRVFIPLIGLMLTAACAAPQQAPSDQAEQVRQAPAAQAAKPGGVFHVPVAGNIANLNPYNLSGSLMNFTNPVYEPLVVRDTAPGKNWYDDQKMAPGLAERWEMPDRNTFLFHLRRGATWHRATDAGHAEPFTSADVVHTINYLKENRGKVNDSSYAANIAKAEAVDGFTVRMTLSLPNPDFLNDVYNIEIAAKHVADSGKQLENVAIGTGPFMLRQFETATGFKLARNPNYWLQGQGLPYLDGIVGHSMTDRGAVIAAFAADNLDMMNAEDKVQFGTVQNVRPGLSYERFYGQYSYGGYFAMDVPPFNDVRVRRAINLALDRQAMLETAAFGEGVINPPAVYGWKKGYALPQEELLKLPGYNPQTKQQDIQEAKRLLAEAGYPNGFAAKISYGSASTNPKPIAEVMASQLKMLGINLTLVPLDRASYAAAIRDESWEMAIASPGSRDSRADLFEQFHSKGTFNKRGAKDPELDALLERYTAEFDVAAAQRLFHQFQRRVYEQAYFIGAFERASYTIYQPWVHDVLNNYGANPIPYWGPPRAWIDVDAMPAGRRGEKIG